MPSRVFLVGLISLVACGGLDVPAPQSTQDVCESQAPTLSWAGVEGASYQVVLSREGSGEERFDVAAGTTEWSPPNPLAAGTWTWTVRALTDKKESDVSGVESFVVKPTPDAPSVTGETEVCSSGELRLTTSPEGAATYAWMSPSETEYEGDSLVVEAPFAGTWTLVATLDGCSSDPTSVVVTEIDQRISIMQETTEDFAGNTNDGVAVEDDQVALALASPEVGDGSDGVFNPTEDIELASGEYEFSAINIPAGVRVRVVGDEPLLLRSVGAVRIDGTLDVSGQTGGSGVTFDTFGVGGEGTAGGFDGGDGVFIGSPSPGLAGEGPGGGIAGASWSGGGGAAHAGPGLDARGDESAAPYGEPSLAEPLGGSGGGGGSGGNRCGSGGGGGGGGFVRIAAPSIRVGSSGVLSANGGDGGSDGSGSCGSGGGGSAGSVYLIADSVSVADGGVITAVGGQAGTSAIDGSTYYGRGGDGAEGRIRVDGGSVDIPEGGALPEIGMQTQARRERGSTIVSVSGERVCEWGTISYDSAVPDGTALVVDILDAQGTVLAASVASGTDLSGVSALDGVEAIDVRASLSGDSTDTPLLFSWGVDYTGR